MASDVAVVGECGSGWRGEVVGAVKGKGGGVGFRFGLGGDGGEGGVI